MLLLTLFVGRLLVFFLLFLMLFLLVRAHHKN